MNIFLDILCTVPQSFIFALCTYNCLKIKQRKLYYLLMTVLASGAHLIFIYVFHTSDFVRSVVCMATIFVINQIFSQERHSKTAIFTILLIGVLAVTELLGLWIWYMMHGGPFYADMKAVTTAWLIYKVLLLVVLSITMSIYTLLWNKLLRRYSNLSVAFLLFPLSQIFLIAIITDWVLVDPINKFAFQYEITAAGICIVADVLLFFAIKQFGERRVLESQKELAESQLKAQLDYYNNLTNTIEQVSRLRHDMNNQLQTVYSLMESREDAAAHEQVALLQQQWNQVSTKTFCDNKIVDAVLSEKKQLCDSNRIRLNAMVALPQTLSVTGIDLCSIFANIMDNAINACTALPEPQRKIHISAAISANVLTIKAVNPTTTKTLPSAREKEKFVLREHGVGIDILKQIAEKYDGCVTTNISDGNFTAFVQLNLSETLRQARQKAGTTANQ